MTLTIEQVSLSIFGELYDGPKELTHLLGATGFRKDSIENSLELLCQASFIEKKSLNQKTMYSMSSEGKKFVDAEFEKTKKENPEFAEFLGTQEKVWFDFYWQRLPYEYKNSGGEKILKQYIHEKLNASANQYFLKNNKTGIVQKSSLYEC